MLLFLLSVFAMPLQAQEYSETIERTARFENAKDPGNRLRIYNIQGNVSVEGYDGDEIRITAVKQIDGRRSEEVERGKREMQLAVEEESDLVLVYVDAPFIRLQQRDDRFDYRIDSHREDYEYLFDITVQVPRRTSLHASTINRGKVSVQNVEGEELSVSNVNGEVELGRVAGKTRATTVNGDITARYVRSPSADSKYHTINGTIEVYYPEDLSADIRFKSMHGDLYTDFNNIKRLSSQVETSERSRRGGVTYRVDKFTPVRIGSGGPLFDFEVLNGDVYIKRIQS